MFLLAEHFAPAFMHGLVAGQAAHVSQVSPQTLRYSAFCRTSHDPVFQSQSFWRSPPRMTDRRSRCSSIEPLELSMLNPRATAPIIRDLVIILPFRT